MRTRFAPPALLLGLCAALAPLGWSRPAPGQDPKPAEPAPAPAPAIDAAKVAASDLEKLQGSWACTSWVYNGQRPAHNGKIYGSAYDGNRITLFNEGREYRHGLVTLDPARPIKAMNTWDLDGPFVDRTNRAIYELDGDTLRLCIALDSTQARPTEFTSEPGSKRLLVTYERRKP